MEIKKTPKSFDIRSLLMGVMKMMIVIIVMGKSVTSEVRVYDCNSNYTASTKGFPIGLLNAITGDREATGQANLQAEITGANEFSKLVPSIVLVYCDTKSTPDGAVEAAEKLYGLGVRIFIGPETSAMATQVLEWSKSSAPGSFFIGATTTAPSLASNDNFFRVTMSDISQASVVIGSLQKLSISTVIPLVRNDTYGIELIKYIQLAAQQSKGITIGDPIFYPAFAIQTVSDAEPYIRQLQSSLNRAQISSLTSTGDDDDDSSNSQSVNTAVLLISFQEAKYFLLAASDQEDLLSPQWVATDGLAFNIIFNDPDVLQVAQKVRLYSSTYAGDSYPTVERGQFLQKIATRLNVNSVSPAVVLHHDAVQLVYVIEKLHTRRKAVTAAKIKDALQYAPQLVYGLTGRIKLNSAGDRASGYYTIGYLPSQDSGLLLNTPWFIAGETYTLQQNPDPRLEQLVVSSGKSVTYSIQGASMEFLQNLNCEDAQYELKTSDPVTFTPIERTYTKETLPKKLHYSAILPFLLTYSCPATSVKVSLYCPGITQPSEKPLCTVTTQPTDSNDQNLASYYTSYYTSYYFSPGSSEGQSQTSLGGGSDQPVDGTFGSGGTTSTTSQQNFQDLAASASGDDSAAWLAAHNAARQNYQVPNLSWSKELATSALDYANYLANNCLFDHSDGDYGENLSAGLNSPSAIVNQWVNEYKNYDFASFRCRTGVCGHFTQVVWKTTQFVGCAVVPATGCQFTYYAVCQYVRSGNCNGYNYLTDDSPCGRTTVSS